MKRPIRVRATPAVSGLLQIADANLSECSTATAGGSAAAPTQPGTARAATRDVTEASQKPITPYIVGDRRFGFAIERNESATVAAAHFSHALRTAHASQRRGHEAGNPITLNESRREE